MVMLTNNAVVAWTKALRTVLPLSRCHKPRCVLDKPHKGIYHLSHIERMRENVKMEQSGSCSAHSL
jgi:hypothetical protein